MFGGRGQVIMYSGAGGCVPVGLWLHAGGVKTHECMQRAGEWVGSYRE